MEMTSSDYKILFGDDEEIANTALFSSAVREGTHDAISTLTKFAVVGASAFVLGYFFLPKRVTRSLQDKYL